MYICEYSKQWIYQLGETEFLLYFSGDSKFEKNNVIHFISRSDCYQRCQDPDLTREKKFVDQVRLLNMNWFAKQRQLESKEPLMQLQQKET